MYVFLPCCQQLIVDDNLEQHIFGAPGTGFLHHSDRGRSERERTPEVLMGRTYGSVASNIATGSFSAVAMWYQVILKIRLHHGFPTFNAVPWQWFWSAPCWKQMGRIWTFWMAQHVADRCALLRWLGERSDLEMCRGWIISYWNLEVSFRLLIHSCPTN